MQRFDSHAHVNTLDTVAYPVSPLGGHLAPNALSEPLPVADLLAAMDANGVAKAVVVQRAHVYGFDNRYTLDCAAAHRDRLVALCVIDGRADSAPTEAAACFDAGAIGIRLTEPERDRGLDWLDSAAAKAAWAATVARGGSIRVHLFRWNRAAALDAIARQIAAVPETILVVDHLSNLDPTAPDHGVDAALTRLADHGGTSLMFSMINLKRWATEGIDPVPVIDRAVALFGADRVMWGSDVGNTGGSYADMIALADAATVGLSAADRVKVFHDTAARLYAK